MEDNRLFRWGLATFHSGLLVLLLVIFLYRFGNLAGTLKNIGTIPGLAIYIALWFSTWWTTGRAVQDATPDVSFGINEMTWRGAVWGGVNGSIFFVVLFIYLAGLGLSHGSVASLPAIVVVFLVEAVLGSIPAFAIGGIVGLLFSLLDLSLLAIARRILPAEIGA